MPSATRSRWSVIWKCWTSASSTGSCAVHARRRARCRRVRRSRPAPIRRRDGGRLRACDPSRSCRRCRARARKLQHLRAVAADQERDLVLHRTRTRQDRIVGDDLAAQQRAHGLDRLDEVTHARAALGYGRPSIVHSAGVWPAPIPRIMRPFDRTSTVAAPIATESGSRTDAFKTYVPSRNVEVTAAAALERRKGIGRDADVVGDVQRGEPEVLDLARELGPRRARRRSARPVLTGWGHRRSP